MQGLLGRLCSRAVWGALPISLSLQSGAAAAPQGGSGGGGVGYPGPTPSPQGVPPNSHCCWLDGTGLGDLLPLVISLPLCFKCHYKLTGLYSMSNAAGSQQPVFVPIHPLASHLNPQTLASLINLKLLPCLYCLYAYGELCMHLPLNRYMSAVLRAAEAITPHPLLYVGAHP